MYIEQVKAKGRYYVYLRMYDNTIKYGTKKRIIYRFGRLDNAVKNMREWKEHKKELPEELKKLDCNRDDLHYWLKALESKSSPGNIDYTL